MLCVCAVEGTLETNLFCTMVDVDESGGEICWAETTLTVLSGPQKVTVKESAIGISVTVISSST